MASDSSMDIVSQFDLQEVRNAVDQARREINTRFDLKDLGVEIDLTDEDITLTTPSEMSLNTAWDVLLQKLINRKLSPKILKKGEMEKLGGNKVRFTIKLVKVLDQETSKIISKLIREKFPKAKASIQGETVRVSSKSRDELQAIITALRTEKDLPLPLDFTTSCRRIILTHCSSRKEKITQWISSPNSLPLKCWSWGYLEGNTSPIAKMNSQKNGSKMQNSATKNTTPI
jgi:cyclic-di-GMP-binding protein